MHQKELIPMMKALISRYFLLLASAGSLGTFLIARYFGANLELVVLACTVTILVSALMLERVLPFDRAWNQSRGDAKTDLISTGVLLGVVDPTLKLAASVGVAALYAAFPSSNPLAIFPSDAPFALQLLLATTVAEFTRYWAHRWHHARPALWWLHAMHHSSERLYTINNFRFHPLNHAFNFALGVLPLMLAGIPAEVLFAYLAITQPILMLQHANIDLKSGWLNYVLSSNEVHRWHHSAAENEANNNFGSAFVLWDHVFGTFKFSNRSARPQVIGLFANSDNYPAHSSYLTQLLSVLRPECCRA